MWARRVVQATMQRVGLMRLWQYVNRGKVPILMFHGVEPARENGASAPLRRRLSVDDFDRYIQVLSRRFRFVSLDDALEMLSGRRRLQPYSLVLTFDDAYLNNATIAWPILKKYGATATFFLATGYVGTRRTYWLDRLDYAIQHLPPQQQSLEVRGTQYPVGKDKQSLCRLCQQLEDACMALSWRQAEELVKIVEEKANSTLTVPAGDDHWAALMSWEHVRSMQREGASFGSHTVEHYLLDRASSDEARRELADSKAEIEARTGRPCSSIAYPVGRYTQDLAKMAQELGYTSGLTTVEGVANFGDPAMTLPRIGIPAVPLPQVDLLARTTGLSRTLSAVRRLLSRRKRRPR